SAPDRRRGSARTAPRTTALARRSARHRLHRREGLHDRARRSTSDALSLERSRPHLDAPSDRGQREQRRDPLTARDRRDERDHVALAERLVFLREGFISREANGAETTGERGPILLEPRAKLRDRLGVRVHFLLGHADEIANGGEVQDRDQCFFAVPRATSDAWLKIGDAISAPRTAPFVLPGTAKIKQP